MIEIKNVSKSYVKGKKSVDDLNLEIKNGEIFGFLGPNGAGKTTTIRMITGILNMDEGDILIDGKSIKKEPLAAKKNFGFVPDSPDMFLKLKGIEYLMFMADVYDIPQNKRKEKIEELTADIPRDMDEANKFYKIYSRITRMMLYDHNCIEQESKARDNFNKNFWKQDGYNQFKEKIKNIRRNPAGLYGGLIDGKAICAGYALTLHEALKYVGIKSQYVVGFIPRDDGHAWDQVQIDGKWYNADPTWDSSTIQLYGKYEYMLLDDEEFNKTHGKFSARRTETEHKCKSKFDYSKIKGLSLKQIKTEERSGESL